MVLFLYLLSQVTYYQTFVRLKVVKRAMERAKLGATYLILFLVILREKRCERGSQRRQPAIYVRVPIFGRGADPHTCNIHPEVAHTLFFSCV